MNKKSAARNGTIDLMKFLFMILVMLFHTFKAAPGGYIAVDFFFIVSGYLMAKSMKKRMDFPVPLGTDTLGFLLNKAKGIFPTYIVAWCLTFLIGQVLSKASLSESILELFRSPYNMFMLEMAGNYDMGHRIQGSWYISAMLLSMLVLYPIRKKNSNVFDCIIAPVLALLFIGYVYQTGKGISLTVSYIPQLFIYNGLFRGMAGIALGCFCHYLGTLLEEKEFSTLGKTAISIVEWGGYALVFISALKIGRTDRDLVLLLILALSVILSFSGKGILSSLFQHRIFPVLGSFSLQLYLGHECVKNVIFPFLRKHTSFKAVVDVSLLRFLIVYMVSAFAFAFVIWILTRIVEKLTPKVWCWMRRAFMKTDQPKEI